MNTRHAQIVLTIVRFGSITAAAKALYITQPTLSQTLKQIESQLGEPIFVRGRSPMELTPAGELYVQAARRIVQIESQLDEAIASLRGSQEGIVHLGIPDGRSCELLPQVLPDYRAAYPDIRIEVTDGANARLEQMLVSHELDMAILLGDTRRPELSYRLIGSEEIVLLAGKNTALAQRIPSGSTIALAEAASERFAAPAPHLFIGQAFSEIMERGGLRSMQPALILDSLESAKRICAACQMVMLSPFISLLTDTASMQRLSHYHLAAEPYPYKLIAAYPADTQLTPYMEALCTLLTNRFRSMSAYRV